MITYPHTLTRREHDHLPTHIHQKGIWPPTHTHSPVQKGTWSPIHTHSSHGNMITYSHSPQANMTTYPHTHQKGTNMTTYPHTHSPEGNKNESRHTDKTVESSAANIEPKWSQKRGHLWQGVYLHGNWKERFKKTVVWKEGWPLLQMSLIGGFTVMLSILNPPHWSQSLIHQGYKSGKEMTINSVVVSRALELEGHSTDTHCW